MASLTIQARSDSEDVTLRLIPIAVATLRPIAELAFDLYVQGEEGEIPTLYRQRNFPLVQEDIDRLVKADVANLYITELGKLRYQQYLEDNLEDFLANEDTPLSVRCKFLHDAAKGMLQGAFQIIKSDRIVEQANRIGHQVVELISGRELVPMELFRMMRHDYHIFTHMINVSAYSVLLAERLGISDQTELERIACGGLLHDIGMRHVPQIVINREGKLSQREVDQIQRHAQAGFEELHERDDFDWGQLMMVYQHHERCDGSGYPVGILGDEIHWMARLCGVVDVFDMMSSPRKTLKAVHVDDVINYLHDAAGRQYDKEMARCWTMETILSM